jgi:hypothetical protein
MPVIQVVLHRLRDVKVSWRTASGLRRAAVFAGLAGVSAGAAMLTAASALAASGGAAGFPAARGQTLTASYLRQGFTSADNCSAGTCDPGTQTVPISVTVPPPRSTVPPPRSTVPPPGSTVPPPGPTVPPPGSTVPPPSSTVPPPGSFTVTVTGSTVPSTGSAGLLVLGGTLPVITVSDTRSSSPGWSVSGQVSDFTGSGTAAGSIISGNQLGWAPSGAVTGGVTLGSPVAPDSPGLGSIPAVLARAAGGSGFGTDTLSARLQLAIPASGRAGPYNAVLTITCVSSQVKL